MVSACRSLRFETSSSGWLRLRDSLAFSSPMSFSDEGFNSGSLLMAAEAAGLSDPGQDLSQKTKSARRQADFTPFTPFSAFSKHLLFSRRFRWSECTAMAALVLYFQLNYVFPSWTSRVRSPSPAPCFQWFTSLGQNALPRLTSFAKHTHKIGLKLRGFRLPFRDLTLDVFLNVSPHPMTLLVGDDLGV